MIRELVFITIMLAISIYAAIIFVKQIEKKAAGELELGKIGESVFAAIFFVLMYAISALSNIPVLGCIVAIIIAMGCVMLNTYLKGIGLNMTTAMLALWLGNLIASIKEANFTTGNGWQTAYVVIQVILGLLILVGTAVANFRSYVVETRSEDDTADSEEEDVEASSEEVVEEDDDDDDEARRDALILRGFKIAGLVLFVVILVLIGFWLEAKFDFFPPYVQ